MPHEYPNKYARVRGAGTGHHPAREQRVQPIISKSEIKQRMIENGYQPVGGAPEKFGEFIRAEIAKWAPVAKAANIRVD